MKFQFCGEVDCPDWVLVEINTLSRLSSIKLKSLSQIVAQGLINPPIDIEKAEKLFADTKQFSEIDLKACIACITYILTSAARFNCDSNMLQKELQQLGLPIEHSTSIKRVINDQITQLTEKFRTSSLKVNTLEKVSTAIDKDTNCVFLELTVNGCVNRTLATPKTINALLENLKSVRKYMAELNEVS